MSRIVEAADALRIACKEVVSKGWTIQRGVTLTDSGKVQQCCALGAVFLETRCCFDHTDAITYAADKLGMNEEEVAVFVEGFDDTTIIVSDEPEWRILGRQIAHEFVE